MLKVPEYYYREDLQAMLREYNHATTDEEMRNVASRLAGLVLGILRDNPEQAAPDLGAAYRDTVSPLGRK